MNITKRFATVGIAALLTAGGASAAVAASGSSSPTTAAATSSQPAKDASKPKAEFVCANLTTIKSQLDARLTFLQSSLGSLQTLEASAKSSGYDKAVAKLDHRIEKVEQRIAKVTERETKLDTFAAAHCNS